MYKSFGYLTILFLTSFDVHAFTILSKSTFPGNTITVDYNSSECAPTTAAGLEDLIGKAMKRTWNSVAWIRIKLVAGTESSSTFDDVSALPENHIIVECDTSFRTRDTTAVGIGGPSSNSSGQRVGHVVLHEDPSGGTRFSAMGETYQINVLAHEVGHALGLGHSANMKANMAPTANGENNITDDDVAGITSLYGVAGFADFFSCTGVRSINRDIGPGDFNSLFALLGMMGLLMIVRQRLLIAHRGR